MATMSLPSTPTISPSLILRPRTCTFTSLCCSSSSLFGPSLISPKFPKPRKIPPFSTTISMSMEAGVGVMGTKLGMMSFFEPGGTVVPVTVVGFREGNIVTQVKTETTDGYNAVQVGYRRVRDRKLTKPEMGHLQKSEIIPLRHLQEFRLVSVDGFEPNQRLVLEELFKEGDLVDVSGTTIGKGFQGGIKRHNFKRGLMTHGSKSHRALGSIGAGTTPGRVYKGKKMPGRMGGTKRKIRKLKIMKIDNDLRIVMIKGALPGKPGNLLRITPAKIVGKNIPKSLEAGIAVFCNHQCLEPPLGINVAWKVTPILCGWFFDGSELMTEIRDSDLTQHSLLNHPSPVDSKRHLLSPLVDSEGRESNECGFSTLKIDSGRAMIVDLARATYVDSPRIVRNYCNCSFELVI
ncbi:hypothetical protein TEA_024998 [Camellia sinensis var. sinensis]|uniref:Large ribosomal subunit protein uL3c n=2 Tax=Camellia sinensis TaxID=4442 RepID=A0A4S4DG59_CAMSN|nr:hypothetical protein TEA_024998 [Camellia sinensis var. sinensis]